MIFLRISLVIRKASSKFLEPKASVNCALSCVISSVLMNAFLEPKFAQMWAAPRAKRGVAIIVPPSTTAVFPYHGKPQKPFFFSGFLGFDCFSVFFGFLLCLTVTVSPASETAGVLFRSALPVLLGVKLSPSLPVIRPASGSVGWAFVVSPVGIIFLGCMGVTLFCG